MSRDARTYTTEDGIHVRSGRTRDGRRYMAEAKRHPFTDPWPYSDAGADVASWLTDTGPLWFTFAASREEAEAEVIEEARAGV